MRKREKTALLILLLFICLIVFGFLFLKAFIIFDSGPYTKTGVMVKHPTLEETWGLEVNPLVGKNYILSFDEFFSELPQKFKKEGSRVRVKVSLSNEDYDDTPKWSYPVTIIDGQIEFAD